MANINKIKASLSANTGHVTRIIEKSRTALGKEVKVINEIQGLHDRLVTKTREIETLQISYLTELELDDSYQSDEIKKIADSQEDYIEECESLIYKLKEFVQQKEDKSSSNSVSSENSSFNNSQSQRVKLPCIKLETFDGTFAHWTSFWDNFEANIHSRTDITNVDKFAYLKGVLLGNAKERIKNYPVTKDNYDKVIEILRNTYACKEKNHMGPRL